MVTNAAKYFNALIHTEGVGISILHSKLKCDIEKKQTVIAVMFAQGVHRDVIARQLKTRRNVVDRHYREWKTIAAKEDIQKLFAKLLQVPAV